MAKNLQVGEHVYVPRARIGLDANGPSALIRRPIAAVQGRSVRVTLNGNSLSAAVAASAVYRNVGVLLVRVGDLQTEEFLLDPLAKSVLQYLRLLLPDDMVVCREIRSIDEFVAYWHAGHAAVSHLVLVGHGSKDSIFFGVDGAVVATRLAEVLCAPSPSPKSILCLSCQTGYAAFGKAISSSSACGSFVAPFHSVHGATASQFCQTFLAYHLLEGETARVAFRHASEAVPGGKVFRLWENGKLTGRNR